MTWIFIALGGYFMNALAGIVDKFLLSEGRIGSPVLYAFFTSVASVFVIVIFPFGFVEWGPKAMSLAIVSGGLFVFGLVALYEAVRQTEVSRAAPLVGISTVGFVFITSMFFRLVSGGEIDLRGILAVLLLAAGSFLLAKEDDGRMRKGFLRSVLAAGALMAASLVLLKESYQASDFVSGFVWSRMGMFVTGISFLLLPMFRADILTHVEHVAKPTKRNVATGAFFFLNKGFGGLGAFLIAYAVSLGPITFVQALSGTQFAFLFLLVVPLSMRYPTIFRERLDQRELFRKLTAIMLLACGVALATTGGTLAGFL
jgi:drug/metabolite transporter (DMT)-like permease